MRDLYNAMGAERRNTWPGRPKVAGASVLSHPILGGASKRDSEAAGSGDGSERDTDAGGGSEGGGSEGVVTTVREWHSPLRRVLQTVPADVKAKLLQAAGTPSSWCSMPKDAEVHLLCSLLQLVADEIVSREKWLHELQRDRSKTREVLRRCTQVGAREAPPAATCCSSLLYDLLLRPIASPPSPPSPHPLTQHLRRVEKEAKQLQQSYGQGPAGLSTMSSSPPEPSSHTGSHSGSRGPSRDSSFRRRTGNLGYELDALLEGEHDDDEGPQSPHRPQRPTAHLRKCHLSSNLSTYRCSRRPSPRIRSLLLTPPLPLAFDLSHLSQSDSQSARARAPKRSSSRTRRYRRRSSLRCALHAATR